MMADPFSIIAGTAGLLDVCWRTVKYLRDVQVAAATVEEEIAALLHEIEALISVNQAIHEIFSIQLHGPPVSIADQTHYENLCRDIRRLLQDCKATVEKLTFLVKGIIGKEGPKVVGKLDGFKKQLRRQSKDDDFLHLRQQLANCQGGLQLLLTALNIFYTRRSQTITDVSLDQLSENLQVLGIDLKTQIASLQPKIETTHDRNLRDSIKSATAVAALVPSNEHFSIPQTVSSIFTGRQSFLRNLRDLFDAPITPGHVQTQKRFVIYGLGGSGKTQFSCKFAQDNRPNFWGIFWVDANSEENLKTSFSRIAKIGEVEPNERAAKNWLSSLEYPWLLLIDSADNPRISLDTYFPEGERGHILVTTRNPAHKVHGTVGPGFWHFEKLEDDDASSLLLKAAGEPSPWSLSAKRSAVGIAKALVSLPLALVHAGKAIMNNLCTLENYLDFYNRNWQRIRRARTLSGYNGDDANMNVYSSYEVIYQSLEASEKEQAKDAVELLKIFSFFHCENVRMDILVQAAMNPKLEREEQEREHSRTLASGGLKPQSWKWNFKDIASRMLAVLYKDRSNPVLPAVLRSIETIGPFDDLRMRVALNELTQMSLITHNHTNDSYFVHPLVHVWVRERPQMSTAEQAVWCQAAATILAQCILLPPLGDTESDEDLRRDLLPHVDHIQKCQQNIKATIEENQKARKRPWPVFGPTLTRGQILQLAKFSRIYSQSGRWDEAGRLQVIVKDFCCKMLGMEHPTTTNIMLALSGTYWQQSRHEEALLLQNQVLQACVASLGADHHKTLKVMDQLGKSYCYQARLKEALALHHKAIEGMTKTLGEDHEDTLLAMDNLGQVNYRYFRWNEAREWHGKAVAGLTKVLGPTHLDTLVAMENLAMTYLETGENMLGLAHELMLQVLEQRKKKLGKEQPYTLQAILNLSRIKGAMGDLDEAEALIRVTLPIAERNLGVDHLGPLSGRVHLANIIVRQERYREAEDMIITVIQSQGYKTSSGDREHPDRLIAKWYLLQCYRKQGKIQEALGMVDEILDGLRTIGGGNHPLAVRVVETQKELLDQQKSRTLISV